ncbi:MAG: signal peptidase II [Clostridia bacterium]|nr:signal peptidase II [Clostridia bacterium]
MWIWLCIIVGSVGLDQLTKWLAVTFLMGKKSVDLIPSVFRFTYVENDGAAFGMLDDHRWIFMVISTVAIVGLLVYLLKFAPDSKWVKVGLSLVIGGGIGNMIDRVALGYVIDFLDFCAFPNLWPWVFNVADSFVCVGGGIIFVWCICSMIQEVKQNKQRKDGDAS